MELLETLSPSHLWLIAGMVLLALEAFGISGVGLLFAGIAAFVVGTLVGTEMVEQDAHLAQFAWWFGITAVTAALLWKPMKRWRTSPGEAGDYANMLGSTATVVQQDLVRGKTGKAKWSGAVMSAELAEECDAESIPVGEAASIAAIDGTTLKLKPRM